MSLRVKTPLRVNPKLADEHSEAVQAIADRAYAEAIEHGWGEERAQAWRQSHLDNPLLWTYR